MSRSAHVYNVFGTNTPLQQVTVMIHGNFVEGLLDTGSEITIYSEKLCKRIKQKIQKTNISLKAANEKSIECCG